MESILFIFACTWGEEKRGETKNDKQNETQLQRVQFGDTRHIHAFHWDTGADERLVQIKLGTPFPSSLSRLIVSRPPWNILQYLIITKDISFRKVQYWRPYSDFMKYIVITMWISKVMLFAFLGSETCIWLDSRVWVYQENHFLKSIGALSAPIIYMGGFEHLNGTTRLIYLFNAMHTSDQWAAYPSTPPPSHTHTYTHIILQIIKKDHRLDDARRWCSCMEMVNTVTKTRCAIRIK